MMPIRLDERLYAIGCLVDYGSVADIGCDHGKLSYWLIGTDRASKVIATDISAPSLKKAAELALVNGVEGRMITRLGDGLAPIADGEVDTVVIAGLGGDLMSRMLAAAHAEGKRFAHYVLSPNTHPEKVRAQLVATGNRIIVDKCVMCAGKRYTVLKTEVGQMSLTPSQLLFGTDYLDDAETLNALRQELEMRRKLSEENPDSQALKDRIKVLETALEMSKQEDKL